MPDPDRMHDVADAGARIAAIEHDIRRSACPYQWHICGDHSKLPKGDYCRVASKPPQQWNFESCLLYLNKEKCWKLWDEEQAQQEATDA